MVNYQINNNVLTLYYPNGQAGYIFLNADSGKIFFRYKIDAMFTIEHPAVYLGQDINGVNYFVHNHIDAGTAVVVNEYEFTQGMPYYLDKRSCSNSWLQVIQSALNQVLAQEPYQFSGYNCQTFTNIACTNTRKSETIEKIVGSIAVGLFAVWAGNALFGIR